MVLVCGLFLQFLLTLLFFFFFFKQKTAYEMRISDWSSDVCSSDLIRIADDRQNRPERLLVHNGGAFLDIPHYCQRNKIARTFGHVATCDDLAARTCALQIAEYLVILRLVLDLPELRLRITATRYLRSSGISDDQIGRAHV